MIEIIDSNERFEHQRGPSTLILRRMPVEVHATITEKNTTRVKLEHGQWIDKVDRTGVLLDSVDYCLVGWRKVIHPVSKEDVPCTTENKRLLPAKNMEEIMSTVAEAEEAAAARTRQTLEQIERFLKTKADYPNLNCESCRKETDEPPTCETCPIHGLVNDTEDAEQIYNFISAPFFRRFPALVPDTITLLLPPMTREQGAMTVLKLAMIHQFRARRAQHVG